MRTPLIKMITGTILSSLLITGACWGQVREFYEFRATHINTPSEQNRDVWGEWKRVTSDITFTWDRDAKVATIHGYDAATNKGVDKKFIIKKLMDNDECDEDYACFAAKAIDVEDYSSLVIELEIPINAELGFKAIASFTYDDYWDLADNYTGTHAFALTLVPKL